MGGTVIIDSQGAPGVPIESIRVEYDAEHLFSGSGVVSQFQLSTTGKTYSVSIFNATASEEPNALGLSSLLRGRLGPETGQPLANGFSADHSLHVPFSRRFS